jgi:hypothetical protein
MIHWGAVPAGSVIPFPFATYGATNGESITLSGLAVTDVEVYKGTSMTQRASDAGYALMDTDGIDIDGVTGIHGFSIDTSNDTDAGFFVAGSLYWVVVSAVTVDTQTVNFLAGTFQLVLATPAVAGDAMTLTAGERTSIADALLGRNIAGGSSAGRTVKQALYRLRNRVAVSAGTATVYQVDDATSEWTAAVTTTAGNPVTEIDPA